MYWNSTADCHSNWRISVKFWCFNRCPRPFTSFFSVFNDGNNKELLNINGTIPVVYKSKSQRNADISIKFLTIILSFNSK